MAFLDDFFGDRSLDLVDPFIDNVVNFVSSFFSPNKSARELNLWKSIHRGDLQAVSALLAQDIDVTSRIYNGRSALDVAVDCCYYSLPLCVESSVPDVSDMMKNGVNFAIRRLLMEEAGVVGSSHFVSHVEVFSSRIVGEPGIAG